MAKFAELRDYPLKLLSRHSKIVKGIIYGIVFILYNAFWIGSMARYVNQGKEFEWCDGIGFLTILTIIVYTGNLL